MPILLTETKAKICANVECLKEFNRLLRGPGRKKAESVPVYLAKEYCSRPCKDYCRRTSAPFKICKAVTCQKPFSQEDCVNKQSYYVQVYCSMHCRDVSMRKDPTRTQKEARKGRVSLRKKANQYGVAGRGKGRAPRVITRREPTVKAEFIFPEGPRKEVWRPASWRTDDV